jgi:hypothetical protein
MKGRDVTNIQVDNITINMSSADLKNTYEKKIVLFKGASSIF